MAASAGERPNTRAVEWRRWRASGRTQGLGAWGARRLVGYGGHRVKRCAARKTSTCGASLAAPATAFSYGYPTFVATMPTMPTNSSFASSRYSGAGASGDNMRELVSAASQRLAAERAAAVELATVPRSQSVAMARIDKDQPCEFSGVGLVFPRSCAVGSGLVGGGGGGWLPWHEQPPPSPLARPNDGGLWSHSPPPLERLVAAVPTPSGAAMAKGMGAASTRILPPPSLGAAEVETKAAASFPL